MPDAVLHVNTELLALDSGHWCRACALPSGHRAVVAMTIGPRVSVSTVVRCGECRGDDIELADT